MMSVLVGLTALSGLALIAGSIWLLASGGETTYKSGEEIGQEVLGEQMQHEWEEPVARGTAFKGRASSRSRQASLSIPEVKAAAKSGRWAEALPVLLAIAGLLGLLFFGALALFVALDDKLVGGILAAGVIFTVLRLTVRIIRA